MCAGIVFMYYCRDCRRAAKIWYGTYSYMCLGWCSASAPSPLRLGNGVSLRALVRTSSTRAATRKGLEGAAKELTATSERESGGFECFQIPFMWPQRPPFSVRPRTMSQSKCGALSVRTAHEPRGRARFYQRRRSRFYLANGVSEALKCCS